MFETEEDVLNFPWDIRREGYRWHGQHAHDRYQLSAEKVEMIGGKIFGPEIDRLSMLGLLLENVGMDTALQFGDLRVWREALEAREAESR